MKDLRFHYTVTSADGFDYSQAHGYGNLNESTPYPAKLIEHAKKGIAMAKEFSENKQDDGLTMTLSLTIDGKADGDVIVKGVSYKELSKFQRWLQDTSNEVVGWGEKMSDEKDKKRSWGGRTEQNPGRTEPDRGDGRRRT